MGGMVFFIKIFTHIFVATNKKKSLTNSVSAHPRDHRALGGRFVLRARIHHINSLAQRNIQFATELSCLFSDEK